MAPYGALWNRIGSYETLRSPMEPYGSPWSPMKPCEAPQSLMKPYATRRSLIEGLRNPLGFHAAYKTL